MSEHHVHDEHTSFIRTPKQLVAVIVLAFLVPITLISILASLASRSGGHDAGVNSEEAVARRLKPVGEIVISEGSFGYLIPMDLGASLAQGLDIHPYRRASAA